MLASRSRKSGRKKHCRPSSSRSPPRKRISSSRRSIRCSALAKADDEKLAAILSRVSPKAEGLRKMLDDLGADLQGKSGSTEAPEVPFGEELLEEHNLVVLYFDNSVDLLNLLSILALPTVQARAVCIGNAASPDGGLWLGNRCHRFVGVFFIT